MSETPNALLDEVSCELDNDELLRPLLAVSPEAPMLGGVLLKNKLGEGGIGAVYLGWHTRLNVQVAVKVLKNATPANVPMFLREARMMVSIEHPNLVRVFDVNYDAAANLHYIIMEYVEGKSAIQLLDERLSKDGRVLGEMAALEIVLSTARALGALHRAGITHRDIKSDNILIRKDGMVKLTDLGFATKNREMSIAEFPRSTQQNCVVGTLGFLSPEVLIGNEATAAADIYGLGATLFELVTGQLPHGAPYDDTYYNRQLSGEVPDILRHNRQVSLNTARLLQRCLSLDPNRRFADGDTLVRQIEANFLAMGYHPSQELAAVLEEPPGKPVVLCVDDDSDVLELMRDVLEVEGFRPICFTNGFEALENLGQINPDVAVVDFKMPKVDGITLSKELRKRQGFDDLGVLILSATNENEVIDRALQSGVDDFLLKPINSRNLVKRLKLLSKLRGMRRERKVIETQLLQMKRKSSGLRAACLSKKI